VGCSGWNVGFDPARYAVCAALMFAATLCSGCGSQASSTTSDQPAPAPGPAPASTPRAPAAGDLRFQQVDAASEVQQGLSSGDINLLVSSGVSTSINFPNATASPLELSYGTCVANMLDDCSWGGWITPLAAGQGGLTAVGQGGYYENFESDLSAFSASNKVITSLDFQPAADAYAFVGIETSQTVPFDMKQEVVTPSQAPAAAAQDGAESRVITAVAFDANGNVNLFSYGWQDDTTTEYDTSVTAASADGVAAAATNLAGAGYIITAFGGDSTNGYLLVGTKVHGDTLPRPILVATPSDTPFSPGETAGYAPVGSVQYLTDNNTHSYATIFEK
jgi:hypothetical protein